MADESVPKPNSDTINVTAAWAPGDALRTHHVNHMIVTFQGGDFYMTFGEIEQLMPWHSGPDANPPKIVPVVRLALSPERMVAIADTVQKNLEQFREQIRRAKSEQSHE